MAGPPAVGASTYGPLVRGHLTNLPLNTREHAERRPGAPGPAARPAPRRSCCRLRRGPYAAGLRRHHSSRPSSAKTPRPAPTRSSSCSQVAIARPRRRVVQRHARERRHRPARLHDRRTGRRVRSCRGHGSHRAAAAQRARGRHVLDFITPSCPDAPGRRLRPADRDRAVLGHRGHLRGVVRRLAGDPAGQPARPHPLARHHPRGEPRGHLRRPPVRDHGRLDAGPDRRPPAGGSSTSTTPARPRSSPARPPPTSAPPPATTSSSPRPWRASPTRPTTRR
jgi:hypothetical protein